MKNFKIKPFVAFSVLSIVLMACSTSKTTASTNTETKKISANTELTTKTKKQQDLTVKTKVPNQAVLTTGDGSTKTVMTKQKTLIKKKQEITVVK